MKEFRNSRADSSGNQSADDAARRAANIVGAQRRGKKLFTFPPAPTEEAAEHLLNVSRYVARMQRDTAAAVLAERFNFTQGASFAETYLRLVGAERGTEATVFFLWIDSWLKSGLLIAVHEAVDTCEGNTAQERWDSFRQSCKEIPGVVLSDMIAALYAFPRTGNPPEMYDGPAEFGKLVLARCPGRLTDEDRQDVLGEVRIELNKLKTPGAPSMSLDAVADRIARKLRPKDETTIGDCALGAADIDPGFGLQEISAVVESAGLNSNEREIIELVLRDMTLLDHGGSLELVEELKRLGLDRTYEQVRQDKSRALRKLKAALDLYNP